MLLGTLNDLDYKLDRARYVLTNADGKGLSLIHISRAARPDVGIITCIGVSHIGNLGSQENICKAKLEICNGLPEGAPLVLNYDDPFLRKAVLPAHVRPVWFSLSDENADVCALSIRQETDGMSFVLEDQEHGTFVVNIPAMGCLLYTSTVSSSLVLLV